MKNNTKIFDKVLFVFGFIFLFSGLGMMLHAFVETSMHTEQLLLQILGGAIFMFLGFKIAKVAGEFVCFKKKE